jgi:hypothetical protein
MALIAEKAEQVRRDEMKRGDVIARESRSAEENALRDAEDEEARLNQEAEDARAALDRDGSLPGAANPPAPPGNPATPFVANTPAIPPAAPVATPQLFPIEVNGGVVHVTQEQLLALARDGAKFHTQQQAPQPPPRQAQPPQQQTPAPVPQPFLDENTAKAMARQIAYGSEEEGAQALANLAANIAQRVQASQVDPNRLAQVTAAHVRDQMTLESNLQTIGQEFPEIFGDTTRSQLAALKLHEIRQRDAALGVQKSNLELYREACSMVRTSLGTPQPRPAENTPPPVPQAAPNTVVSRDDRLAGKRAAPRPVRPASQRAPETMERAPTGAEIVNQMRKARGQSALA